ncbi:MAG TPA: hypothetical protein VE865_16825, partial [Bradyrhizobium sp.]|nr:hypothetical protein [Bradyrhizobium sp.]
PETSVPLAPNGGQRRLPPGSFDLRPFVEDPTEPAIDREKLRERRPHANDLLRTAFTSGTTGDPKAVLHLYNTTNCAARFVNEGHRIDVRSRWNVRVW